MSAEVAVYSHSARARRPIMSLSLICRLLCRLLGLLGFRLVRLLWEFLIKVGLTSVGPHVQIIGALESSNNSDCLAISFEVLHII